MSLLGLVSGAFFPLALLPGLAETAGRGQPGGDRDRGHARGADRRVRLGGHRASSWCSCRCRRPRCSPASWRSAPRWRASTGAGRWGCTDDVGPDRQPCSRVRRARTRCGCIASSCWRRAGAGRPGWTPAPGGDEGLGAAGDLAADPAAHARPRRRGTGRWLLIKGPEVALDYPGPRLRRVPRPRPPDGRRRARAGRAARRRLREVDDPENYRDIHHLRPLWWPGLPLVVELHSRPKWPDGLAAAADRGAARPPPCRGGSAPALTPWRPAHHTLIARRARVGARAAGPARATSSTSPWPRQLSDPEAVAALARRLGLRAHVAHDARRRPRGARGRGPLRRRSPSGRATSAPCASARCSSGTSRSCWRRSGACRRHRAGARRARS